MPLDAPTASPGSSAAISSPVVSSPSSSSIHDKGAKKLVKLMAKEAKVEQKGYDHALKDVRAAEKAYDKSVKEAEKAEKVLQKAKVKEYATANTLSKAKHKHDEALSKQAVAEGKYGTKKEYEVETNKCVEQRRSDLQDCQDTMKANAADRDNRLSEVRGMYGAQPPTPRL